MSLRSVSRRWPSPNAEICRQCARQLLATQQPQRRQLLQAQQRRHMTGKAFAKYGPKYTAKIEAANDEWTEKGLRIKAGEQKAMWDIFEERGYVKDVAGDREEIKNLMTEKRIGAYVGIDPTAPSLHVGHLLPLMPLFWMYMNGFRAITLVGGATAKIGDPTDRLQSRENVKSATVAMNMIKIHYQLKKIWTNVDEQAARFGYEKNWAWRRGLLQNGHWWNKLSMLEVLQRLGAGLRIGPMLSRDTVKRKLTEGDGMSFAEFTYPLMQAWDWWHMYNSLGVQMQIGGSDQFGNIVTGVDAFKIIRASEPDPNKVLPRGVMYDPVGFTVPLLTDSSGAKFGKSAGNALWLDKFQTPTNDLYGYFMRRPDADVEGLLRMFTFLPMEEIASLMAKHEEDPSQRIPHHALASEVVTLVHGKGEANEARERQLATYGKKTSSDTVAVGGLAEGEELDPSGKIPITPNNAPRPDMQLPRALFNEGKVARILYAAGLVKSVSEGNRVAIQKGAYVGASPGQYAHEQKGMPLTQLDFTPVHLWFPEDTKRFIIDDKYMVLRRGQHNLRVIEIVSDEEWAESGRTYPGQPFTGKVRKLRNELQTLRKNMAQLQQEDEFSSMETGSKGAAKSEYEGMEAEALDEAEAEYQLNPLVEKYDKNGLLIFPDAESKKVRKMQDKIAKARNKYLITNNNGKGKSRDGGIP